MDDDELIRVAQSTDANARSPHGDTAAHVIARSATNAEAARAQLTELLARGADLSSLNRAGQTPLDVATDARVRQVVQELGGKTARQAVKPTPTHRKR